MESGCTPHQYPRTFHQQSTSHYILLGIRAVVHTMNYGANFSARGKKVSDLLLTEVVSMWFLQRKLRQVERMQIGPTEWG